MEDKEKIKIATLSFLIGVVLAFIIYPKPEEETVYKFTTKTETDTAYVEVIDTVYIPKKEIKTQVLRDTVVVDFKPQIKAFETTFPFEYGSTKVSQFLVTTERKRILRGQQVHIPVPVPAIAGYPPDWCVKEIVLIRNNSDNVKDI